MRRLRISTAVALVTFAAVLSPATALDVDRGLTVSASRTSYVTVTVTRRTTVSFREAKVTRAGRYGGLAIAGHGFVLTSDDVMNTYTLDRVTFRPDAVLDPGTYRVYIVSDGEQVTVRLPWSAPDMSVKATVPVDHKLVVERRTVLDGGWEVLVPAIGGAPTDQVYGIAMYDSRHAVPGRVVVQSCLTRATTGCERAFQGIGNAATVTVNGLVAGFAVSGSDTRGYHAIGRVDGATPLSELTVVGLRIAGAAR